MLSGRIYAVFHSKREQIWFSFLAVSDTSIATLCALWFITLHLLNRQMWMAFEQNLISSPTTKYIYIYNLFITSAIHKCVSLLLKSLTKFNSMVSFAPNIPCVVSHTAQGCYANLNWFKTKKFFSFQFRRIGIEIIFRLDTDQSWKDDNETMACVLWYSWFRKKWNIRIVLPKNKTNQVNESMEFTNFSSYWIKAEQIMAETNIYQQTICIKTSPKHLIEGTLSQNYKLDF